VIFGINFSVIAALGIAGLLLLGTVGYQGYSVGYEMAEGRGQKKIQAIKDEIARANAVIRQDEARRQREIEALLEARAEEAIAHAEREIEAQQRIADYEAMLKTRPECRLDQSDVDSVR